MTEAEHEDLVVRNATCRVSQQIAATLNAIANRLQVASAKFGTPSTFDESLVKDLVRSVIANAAASPSYHDAVRIEDPLDELPNPNLAIDRVLAEIFQMRMEVYRGLDLSDADDVRLDATATEPVQSCG